MPKLQTHYHFNLIYKKWTNKKEASGYSTAMAPNTVRTISCKAWNSPVEYTSRETKHDIRNPKVTCSIQYWKGMSRERNIHMARFAEPELLSTESLNMQFKIKTCHKHGDVIRWKHFHVTGPLWGEYTGHRWIPLTKASDAELWCLLWSATE